MLSGVKRWRNSPPPRFLRARCPRAPHAQHAHRQEPGGLVDVKLADIRIGDQLTGPAHEICPVDGTVLEGHGIMDEAYLTGEPYEISKTPGSMVISGAINGEQALLIRAEKVAEDSRYARIMKVMHDTEQQRPKLRRLGDQLGAWYTPLALAVAVVAALLSRDPQRFLAVVVIATPCPLLLAIPTAIIGAISLAARRAIIIKNPAILEQLEKCRTLIFDKTGTLTYGRPKLTEVLCAEGFDRTGVLRFAASVEQYSKHPLASAIVSAAKQEQLDVLSVAHISERRDKACSPTSKATPFRSPAATRCMRSLCPCRSFPAASNASFSLMENTPPPFASTMPRAKTALPSSSTCSQNTASEK